MFTSPFAIKKVKNKIIAIYTHKQAYTWCRKSSLKIKGFTDGLILEEIRCRSC